MIGLMLLSLLTACVKSVPEVAQPGSKLGYPVLGGSAERSGLTLQQCRKQGGSVIGDIGDGRIHRANFVCASGRKPLGYIIYNENQSAPIEGAVCCV